MTPLRLTAILFCGWIVGCSPKENQSSTADTTKISSSDIGHITTADVDVNVNQAFVAIEASALADELQKVNPMEGTFLSAEMVSDKVLDVSDIKGSREMLAIWIQTGDGEYQGGRDQEYQTIYSRLAVFEMIDTITKLVDIKDFESSSGGLQLYEERIETYDLTDSRQAIVVHHESSESGAGDYSFSLDEIEVFAIKDNKIVSIFATTLTDNKYSSDEVSAWSELKMTSELTILESSTNGLFDISVYTVKEETSGGEEEGEESESEDDAEDTEQTNTEQAPEESTEHEGVYPAEPATIVYHWNGDEYVADDVD